MTTAFGREYARLVAELARSPNAALSETPEECRVDDVTCGDAAALARIAAAARLATSEGFGDIRAYGSISDEIDLATCLFEDVAAERLAVVLSKARSSGWCYFVTERGFGMALDDRLVASPLAIWIASDFQPFSTATLTVSPWDGPRVHEPNAERMERPRKFVRDLTHGRAPLEIAPWVLNEVPSDRSGAFTAWCEKAVERLAYSIPGEIRIVEGDQKVVLKGPRAAPIPVAPPRSEWATGIIQELTEAVTWVYALPREAEARFQFLNNHLSLDWREGSSWPSGLTETLPGSLAGAREAYAFHLQDQSKDALKSLGDLRKSLQDEVAKAQSATRDLLSSLWRDLAVAGVVLALKAPIGATPALRWVTIATAVLLGVSLGFTLFANRRFTALADEARAAWRRKLYAFVSDADWLVLVERPLGRGKRVYRTALPFVVVFYLVAILYLLAVAEPALIDLAVETYRTLRGWLGQTWSIRG